MYGQLLAKTAHVIVYNTYKYISIWIFTVSKMEFILKSDYSLTLDYNQSIHGLPELDLLTLGEPSWGGGLASGSRPSLAILWSCSLCNCWIMLSMFGRLSWATPSGRGRSAGWGGWSGWGSSGCSSIKASRSPTTSCEPMTNEIHVDKKHTVQMQRMNHNHWLFSNLLLWFHD